MTLLLKQKTKSSVGSVESFRVILNDGKQTTVHIAKYPKAKVHPKVVLFETETNLLQWCRQNAIANAMTGGFFLRNERKPLGDMWVAGKQQKTVSFTSPWSYSRGALYISPIGGMSIAPRYLLPQRPQTDILQAGPLLLQDHQIVVDDTLDPEGFSEASQQFDTDITKGRYPRTAIGSSQHHVFSVVCDGYTNDDAGMTFAELAQLMHELGIQNALNLDGGSSSTLIHDYKLINNPYSTEQAYPEGRPIFSAITFE